MSGKVLQFRSEFERIADRFFVEHGLTKPQHAIVVAIAAGNTLAFEGGHGMMVGVAEDGTLFVDRSIEGWQEELGRTVASDLLRAAGIYSDYPSRHALGRLITRRDDHFERTYFQCVEYGERLRRADAVSAFLSALPPVDQIRVRWSDPRHCQSDADEQDVLALLVRIDELEAELATLRGEP